MTIRVQILLTHCQIISEALIKNFAYRDHRADE